MRILVVHGPNLNLLGRREPDVYGTKTLSEVDDELRTLAAELGVEITCVQENSEGAILDALHRAQSEYAAVVLNPGAYSHYSYAIADAVAAIAVPVVEVHLSNIDAREEYRRRSVVATACAGSIRGFGSLSYALGLRAAAALIVR